MNNLKEIRKKAGVTQVEISKMLNIDQTTYSGYETGKSEPNISTLIKLADFYKITVDELIDHEVPYLIYKSSFTNSQNKVVDMLTTLTDRECERVQDFIQGMNSENKK